MGKFFNILVRSLGFLRIDHMNIVIVQELRLMPLHPVSVKHRNHLAFFSSLVITKDIQQLSPGAVYIPFGQFPELFPGKYDVIAVYKQILFPFFFLFGGPNSRGSCSGVAACRISS